MSIENILYLKAVRNFLGGLFRKRSYVSSKFQYQNIDSFSTICQSSDHWFGEPPIHLIAVQALASMILPVLGVCFPKVLCDMSHGPEPRRVYFPFLLSAESFHTKPILRNLIDHLYVIEWVIIVFQSAEHEKKAIRKQCSKITNE